MALLVSIKHEELLSQNKNKETDTRPYFASVLVFWKTKYHIYEQNVSKIMLNTFIASVEVFLNINKLSVG